MHSLRCGSNFLCVMVLLLSCASAVPAERSIEAFFDRIAEQWVEGDPDLATATRYFTGEKQARLERQLTPRTSKWRSERVQLARRAVRELGQFDSSALTPTQRISANLMKWQLERLIAQEPYFDYSFPLQQFSGENVDLVDSLTVRHPLATLQDTHNYLARLEQVAERMDESVAEARRIAAKELIPPRFILQATIDQMRAFMAVPPRDNPYVTTLEQRVPAEVWTQAQRTDAVKRAANIVEREIYPAWRRAVGALEELLPRANDAAGVWRFKEGAQVYANALYRFTSTQLSAEQIHQIGLEQVAQIESQMDAILKKLGRTKGSVRDRIRKLEDDLRYPNPTSQESRTAIMRDIELMMADALERSAELFAQMPKTPVIARPFPRFREANAAANYNRAPFDGSRPALFQMPLRPQRMTKFALRTLIYHETVPGHHFQIALEQENPQLPRFRQARVLGGISALSEGWALYAERLAAENGWYADDPEGLLGQLNAALFRARRLVVDTGLHAKRWTRQQAIDYGMEPSEVERYVVLPGQACAYMIGQLKLIELRDRARRELGGKFSFKEFHSVVLGAGTVPLDMLEEIVGEYISKRAAAGG